MNIKEIFDKFKKKKLNITYDKDIDFLKLGNIDFKSATIYMSSIDLLNFFSWKEVYGEPNYIKEVLTGNTSLFDGNNKTEVENEKGHLLGKLAQIFNSNNIWQLNTDGEYTKEDVKYAGYYKDKSEKDIEYTKKIIWMLEKYKEYLKYANMSNRIYSQRFKNIRKSTKLECLDLTDDEKQYIQAVYEMFNYLNRDCSKKASGKMQFEDIFYFEDQNLLKLLIKNGLDLEKVFEKSPRQDKKFRNKYNSLISNVGTEYLEKILPILRKAKNSFNVPINKLLYDLENEAFCEIEIKSCDKLISYFERVLVMEEEYRKKKEEDERRQKEEDRIRQEKEKQQKKTQIEKVINIIEGLKREKEIEEERKRPIEEGAGKEEEFEKRIQSLKNSNTIKKRVIPIFIEWYDKKKEDISGGNIHMENFKNVLFDKIRKIEEKEKGKVSIFFLSNSSIEECREIMDKMGDEASKRNMDGLVEGITAGYGSYLIESDGQVSKMCTMTDDIRQKIIRSSDRKIASYYDEYEINTNIDSYLRYEFVSGRDWGDMHNRFITKRISEELGRTMHKIKYRPCFDFNDYGVDVILDEQSKVTENIIRYYDSKYDIDLNNVRIINITGCFDEDRLDILKKKSTRKSKKKEEKKDDDIER